MSVRADLLFFLGGCAWLAGCAAVAPPLGGPRDMIPPQLVSTSPDSAALNVQQRSIKLVFSEAVQLKDLSKNLLITPQLPPDNPYKLREERNTVILLFDKPLEENTTYSFNFRNAIVDATESLPAKNARLSFSTGPTIDQGEVSGTVTDALSTKPVDDATIALYRAADTMGVRRGRPYYVGRSDKAGKFELNFLRPGQYKLYAIIDKNNNGRYEDGEKIAYLPAPITIGDSAKSDPAALLMTRPDRRSPILTTQTPSPTTLRLSFDEGLRTASLRPVAAASASTAALNEAIQLTENGHTAILYKTPALTDGRYVLTATDSTDNVLNDTLNVRFPVPAAAGRKVAAVSLYTVEGGLRTVYRQGQVKFNFQVPIRIAANKPIGTLVEDSVKRRPLRMPADAVLSPDRTLLTINLDTKAENRLDILLDSTSITSITGQELHLKPLRLKPTETVPTGTLSGTIQTKNLHFELQLLDERFQVIQTLQSPKGHYQFDNVNPGKYQLRALIDTDGDGRWRGGSPDLLTLPEPVFLSPRPVQIRANFEIEEKLSF